MPHIHFYALFCNPEQIEDPHFSLFLGLPSQGKFVYGVGRENRWDHLAEAKHLAFTLYIKK